MKIDAKLLADHLKIVSMKGRISEVVFKPDFQVEMVDENEEVVVKGKSPKVAFKEGFGVMDLADFVKIVDSFNGEVNMELKDGKIVVGSTVGVISYQTADPDTIRTTIDNFDDKLLPSFLEDLVAEVDVVNSFPGNYNKFQRLTSPDIVEFFMKDGKVAARLVSVKGHKAEIFVGAPKSPVEKTDFVMKISAAALTDVLSGFATTQSHKITLKIGRAVVLSLDDDYIFGISPQAE